MSTIDFYYSPGSAPCRAVLLTAQALGIELNLYKVDQIKGDHMKEEYLKVTIYSCKKYKYYYFLLFPDESRTLNSYHNGWRILFVGVQCHYELLGEQVWQRGTG